MKVNTIQTSFTGGEFGPYLLGRVDVAQYNNACAIVQNMLIRPSGPLISTPGTQYINACKTGGTTGLTRLIPFTFSQTDSYIIEMGAGYFRFYTNGAIVVSSGTTPYEVSHPYQSADLFQIQYCQYNDVIYLTHKNYPPATLTRMGATNWVYSNFSFKGGPFMPQNITPVTLTPTSASSGATISLTAQIPTWAAGTYYVPGTYVLSGSILYNCVVANVGAGVISVTSSPGTYSNNSSGGTLLWSTSGTISFSYTGTTHATSQYLECRNFGFSLPTNTTISGIELDFKRSNYRGTVSDSSIKLSKALVIGGTEHALSGAWSTAGTTVIYGGMNDLWGLTLSPSDINNSGFGVGISANISYNQGQPPAIATAQYVVLKVYYGSGSFANDLASGFWQVANPIFQIGHVGTYWSVGSTVTDATTGLSIQGYVQITSFGTSTAVTATVISVLSTAGATTMWSEGSWSSVRGWPACCAFFQSRLFFARTNSEPQTVWGSYNFQFTNFAVDAGYDDNALNLQLSSTQSNEIKWLSPMNDLIVGSYGGEFAISSGIGSSNPLTPSTVGVSWQTPWGSENIIPRRIGNFVYYVQRYFQKLREVFYVWTSANYKSIDKTILSPHISGGGFVEMAFQENPDTILWLVCTNGTMATMTREIDQEVQGWSRQVTTNGSFLSVAVIPSQIGDYDEVWTIVNRTINGNSVNYIERFGSTILPTQGDYVTVQPDQLFYVHSGLSYSAFDVNTSTSISLSATAGVITITSSSAYFSVGNIGERIRAVDQYDNVLGEMRITSYASTTVVVGSVSTIFNSPSYSSGNWGVSVKTISGISWLEQCAVSVLGDGGVDGSPYTVSNGTITMNSDYFVVTVGLPITQQIMTLPKEAGAQMGTAQGRIQRINEVAFRVNNCYQGFNISGTTGTLQQVVRSNSALFSGVIPNITFSDNYRYGSQVFIQNLDPLPMEFLNIMTTVETFEKG